jgi:YHS domain-containing protein
VNLVRRIVRAVFWGIVVSGLLWMLRRWHSSHVPEETAEPEHRQAPGPILLRRDPCCGTYVAPEISFALEQSGQIEYFCSAECRDRYTRSFQRAASA